MLSIKQPLRPFPMGEAKTKDVRSQAFLRPRKRTLILVSIGTHFRSATVDGLRQGDKLGRFVWNHCLNAVRGR